MASKKNTAADSGNAATAPVESSAGKPIAAQILNIATEEVKAAREKLKAEIIAGKAKMKQAKALARFAEGINSLDEWALDNLQELIAARRELIKQSAGQSVD